MPICLDDIFWYPAQPFQGGQICFNSFRLWPPVSAFEVNWLSFHGAKMPVPNFGEPHRCLSCPGNFLSPTRIARCSANRLLSFRSGFR